ncbi:phosphotransferase [Paenibacillus arenilitoris]|uniref:Aminoglycoside phosphotransferase family protein n=1 Tax=Paenibacillus arenilitoris TaxID=2772299 RepID=A0A927CQA9_9BACL|nr:aminoglycoside phosphotransferase family protein [Paenibacillus arenilitoris]MBD2870306.1 aminoglycoside phosphotransferase family protein [Paenibacillus arenilitoris]
MKANGSNEEIVLSSDKSVYQKGDIVLRPSGPWTPGVHALLRHLRQEGQPVPPVIGTGVDEEGRETLGFMEGEFVHPGPWSDDAIVEVGRMVRRLHDAAATFEPAPDAAWKPWFLRGVGGPAVVFGHGDIAPWNMVTEGGMPIALIDWEFAGPVDPMAELARVCWLFPQLHDDDVAERVGLPPAGTRARQLRLLTDAYGLSADRRRRLYDLILEVVVRETAEEAVEQRVGPDSEGPLWGIAWRARAAAWIMRHRALLQGALD